MIGAGRGRGGGRGIMVIVVGTSSIVHAGGDE